MAPNTSSTPTGVLFEEDNAVINNNNDSNNDIEEIRETSHGGESSSDDGEGLRRQNGRVIIRNGMLKQNGHIGKNGINCNGLQKRTTTEQKANTSDKEHNEEDETKEPQRILVWRNIILFAYFHLAALYGAYLFLFKAKWRTDIWAIILYQASGLGITAGAHRLWAHKSYKAKLPLRLILALFNTIAFQNHIYEWARDHRVHHKYSETNADPHNAKRGFFFSHIGWLLCRKHPEVIEKGKTIDMADLERDPVIFYQRKYYMPLMVFCCFVLPTVVPVFCWGETWTNAWFVAAMFRYVFTLNMTWLVNSAAHMWGGKPYDRFINPSENVGVAVFALGEGWHNYHHVFPWDYKTAELGNYSANFTTAFIDFFANIGWAYDLKTVSWDMVKKRAERTGDGTHPSIWGWGDKDIPKEEEQDVIVINRKED